MTLLIGMQPCAEYRKETVVATDKLEGDSSLVSSRLKKAEIKIELCLYFQICFISDEEIRLDNDDDKARKIYTPRFSRRPSPAKPTERTTTVSPLKLKIQKALRNCFAGDC